MAYRVRQRDLEWRVASICRMLKRPGRDDIWHRRNGQNVATVGGLHLGAWSPGDGWTRYRLMEISNEAGGEGGFGDTSRCFTASEMLAHLDGIIAGLQVERGET